jgi:oligopeptide transport system substrate-binding protein
MFGRMRAFVSICLLTVLVSFAAQLGPSALAAPPRQTEPGVLHMIVGEPSSLDPNLVTVFSIYVTTQLFETLYHLQPDGTLKMLGAESFDVSEDGLVWTFKLNPNAKWSDGQPVTADDWAFS